MPTPAEDRTIRGMPRRHAYGPTAILTITEVAEWLGISFGTSTDSTSLFVGRTDTAVVGQRRHRLLREASARRREWVSGKGKSLELDRRLPGVGRIKRRSSTSDKRTHRRLNTMLTDLHEAGRETLDILRAIRDGVTPPLAVYDTFRIHGVKLPSAEGTQPVVQTMTAWTMAV